LDEIDDAAAAEMMEGIARELEEVPEEIMTIDRRNEIITMMYATGGAEGVRTAL